MFVVLLLGGVGDGEAGESPVRRAQQDLPTVVGSVDGPDLGLDDGVGELGGVRTAEEPETPYC